MALADTLANIEILAPAGSLEAFWAGVNNGADAVYLGAKNFGARAYAANFDLPTLELIIKQAHMRQVKVYLTVNTLINNEEMTEAVKLVVEAWNLGIDAIIVQDLGLVWLLQQNYPEIVLHASTQMTFHNSRSCAKGGDIGFQRLILAREVSLKEMKAISEYLVDNSGANPPELEAFGHGALCICYSGQCLFSSLVGGRSGNRGRCAQPCRLKYKLLPEVGQEQPVHLLSPKDLKAYEYLPAMWQSGIRSVKIEGRMKRPEYVATVVKAYHEARLGDTCSHQDLSKVFNREFTPGYLLKPLGKDLMSYNRPSNRGQKLGRIHQVNSSSLDIKLDNDLQIGDGLEIWVSRGGRQGLTVNGITLSGQEVDRGNKGDIVSICLRDSRIDTRFIVVGDRVFKTYDSSLNQMEYKQPDNLPINFLLTAKLGQELRLKGEFKGNTYEYSSDFIVPAAMKQPATYEQIAKQIGRLGGSGFTIGQLDLQIDECIMLPASVLNNARREVIKGLEEILLADYQRQPMEFHKLQQAFIKKTAVQTKLAALVDSYEEARAAITGGADLLYLDLLPWQGRKKISDKQLEDLIKSTNLYGVLPAIAKENEVTYWRSELSRYQKLGVQGLVISNLWQLKLLQELDWQPQLAGDFPLNAFNNYAMEFWQAQGISRMGLALELNHNQARDIKTNLEKEVLVFGNLPMMVSQHCVLGAARGGSTESSKCTKPCLSHGNYLLEDEKGFKFPVRTDVFCRSHIFNGYKLCLLENIPNLVQDGIDVLRLDCRWQSHQTTTEIVRLFRDAVNSSNYGLDFDYNIAKGQITSLAKAPLTKGHYYRGVE